MRHGGHVTELQPGTGAAPYTAPGVVAELSYAQGAANSDVVMASPPQVALEKPRFGKNDNV